MALQSVVEVLDKCAAYFEKKGVPNAKFDAQALLAKAMGCRRLDLFLRFDEPLMENVLDVFRQYARRRVSREPLQHILGDVDFFGLRLKCDARALIPRHETEELCEIITERYFSDSTAPLRILDLGTGSGAIALALCSHYKNARVVATDSSAEALSLARENASLCSLSDRVEFLEGRWFEPIKDDDKFDIIVSNPPYLSEEEYASAQPEVRLFDPKGALVGSCGGIGDLRLIISGLKPHLAAGGLAAFECGVGQPGLLASEFSSDFCSDVQEDLSRRERFLFLHKKD